MTWQFEAISRKELAQTNMYLHKKWKIFFRNACSNKDMYMPNMGLAQDIIKKTSKKY